MSYIAIYSSAHILLQVLGPFQYGKPECEAYAVVRFAGLLPKGYTTECMERMTDVRHHRYKHPVPLL